MSNISRVFIFKKTKNKKEKTKALLLPLSPEMETRKYKRKSEIKI